MLFVYVKFICSLCYKGSYIKLRDSSWAPAIEDWFTFAFLRGFCVDNPHDAEVLREICNSLKVDRMPSIYITKFFNQVSVAHIVSITL